MSAAHINDEIDSALHDVASKFAAARYGFDERHRLDAPTRRFSPEAWAALAKMGWFSVAVPEAFDGLGFRPTSMIVLAEAAGAMFLSEPLVEALCAATLISAVGSSGQMADLLPRILLGRTRFALALEPSAWLPDRATAPRCDADGRLHGDLPFVVGADIADVLLVRVFGPAGGSSVFVIDTASPGVEIVRYPLIDGRGGASVTLAGASAERLGDSDASADAGINSALLFGALATAADSLGVMVRALDTTVEYLKTRIQFDRPIGANQTLQHRAVDMQVLLGEARAVIDAATQAGDVGTAAFAHAVHAAKAIVDVAARKVAHEMIQMHGGIGMADEHVAGQCLKRVIVNEQIYGRRRDHMRLFAKGVSDDLAMCRVD